MSLINDALKRASQTDRGAGLPAGKASGAPPAPAERGLFFPMALAAVVAVLAASGVWIFWRGMSVNYESVPKISAPGIVSVPPPPVEIPASPAKVEVKAVPMPVTTAPPAFPRLTLEAIFLTRTHPRALINGLTVEEGDEVAGMRVKRIEADKVTVEWKGESEVMEMRKP